VLASNRHITAYTYALLNYACMSSSYRLQSTAYAILMFGLVVCLVCLHLLITLLRALLPYNSTGESTTLRLHSNYTHSMSDMRQSSTFVCVACANMCTHIRIAFYVGCCALQMRLLSLTFLTCGLTLSW
jgi:hypothetical protein